MNDHDENALASMLSEYLQGYAAYRAPAQSPPVPHPKRRVRRSRLVLASVVALIAAVVIAIPLSITLILRSGGPTSPAGVSADGVITGSLVAVGGVPPGLPRPLPGSITARNAGGTVYTTSAGSNGAFFLRVPPGSYTVVGRSPLYDGGRVDCLPTKVPIGPITVATRATVRVELACSVK